MNDRERLEFLKALDKADFEVSDWEAQFIESQLRREQEYGDFEEISFTPKQRQCIDDLVSKYDQRLK